VSSEDADGTLDAKPNAVQEQQEWIGVFGHHLWVLKQNDAHIDFKAVGRNHDIIKDPLDSESLEKLLRVYFQLDISLPSLYKEWAAKDEKFAKLTVKDFQGIRMLAQDPIENLFSFICSSNNNIQRISQMVEKLCLNYGDKIVDYEGKAYFDFPRVERLVGDDVEKKLREESFGYRAGFIAKTAEKIVLNGGVKWVESLKKLEYDEARIQLQTLPGIGRKVLSIMY
jgi:N-glycosylase/DNA lyase